MAPDSVQGCTDSGGFACSWEAAEPQDWTAPWELPFVLMAKASRFCLPSNLPHPPFFYFVKSTQWPDNDSSLGFLFVPLAIVLPSYSSKGERLV